MAQSIGQQQAKNLIYIMFRKAKSQEYSSIQKRIKLFVFHSSFQAFKSELVNGSMLGISLVPADVNLASFVLNTCFQCLAGKSVKTSYAE
jgi:hypothetical protein